jgi:deoxyribodipyrimidine photolyase-related protein
VTNGFRTLEVNRSLARRDAQWYDAAPLDGEPHPNHLEQTFPLPKAYWGQKSGLACLDESVASVMEEGWTHHIPRLMVLSNIAHLLDVQPRELTDWFHVAFIDAYDWVVEPNVFGMGTFALGSAMMTKPYVAGSAYINRMSNHCKSCEFHPKKTCPIGRLYWAYLDRHSSAFAGNHRLSMALRNVAKRSEEMKQIDHQTFLMVQDALANGRTLRPDEQ